MCVVMYGCFYLLIVKQTILTALHLLLIRFSDNGTYDMLKHVGDLLTSNVYILVHVVFVL